MKNRLRILGVEVIAIMLGLIAGVLVWGKVEPKLLPDLSEEPSVVSYYTTRPASYKLLDPSGR